MRIPFKVEVSDGGRALRIAADLEPRQALMAGAALGAVAGAVRLACAFYRALPSIDPAELDLLDAEYPGQ